MLAVNRVKAFGFVAPSCRDIDALSSLLFKYAVTNRTLDGLIASQVGWIGRQVRFYRN